MNIKNSNFSVIGDTVPISIPSRCSPRYLFKASNHPPNHIYPSFFEEKLSAHREVILLQFFVPVLCCVSLSIAHSYWTSDFQALLLVIIFFFVVSNPPVKSPTDRLDPPASMSATIRFNLASRPWDCTQFLLRLALPNHIIVKSNPLHSVMATNDDPQRIPDLSPTPLSISPSSMPNFR